VIIEKAVYQANKKKSAISLARSVISMLEESDSASILMPIIKQAKRSLHNLMRDSRVKTDEWAENNQKRKNKINATSRKTAVNARQRWTGEEDRLIVTSSLVDEHLSRLMGRSVQAIIGRRHILRKMNTVSVTSIGEEAFSIVEGRT